MKNEIQNLGQILDTQITGYHQIVLEEPVYLQAVSQNLCTMLGCSREELLSETEDLYAQRVHPADRERYQAFVQALKTGPQTRNCEYRILKKDGSYLDVSDCVHTAYQDSGVLVGNSVLTDITHLRQENRDLQFLNEAMPCGFLRYTCEKVPKILYINQQMLDFLGFPKEHQEEELELYRQNLYLLIPIEERRRFAGYLEKVSQQETPLAGEMTVQRCDGSKAHLFGWVSKCINDQGEPEFQSACLDMTAHYHKKKERETQRYLAAMAEIYDKIFAYDKSAHTVTCLHGGDSPIFRWTEQIPMPMEQATQKWIADTVAPQDRERMLAFFEAFFTQPQQRSDAPPVIRYRAQSRDGTWRNYSGLFVQLDGTTSLFCCRRLREQEETELLRSENTSLKGINESMQKIVMNFTDGLASFEVVDGMVTPLYASDNVCEFFGYTREQWLSIMKTRTPIDAFLAHSKAEYADFMELLRKGEAEFTYADLKAGKSRRIKAVCSRKSTGKAGPMYVMLYHIEEEARPSDAKAHVRIRTFGYFDVFVDDKPIAFRNEKSKELFALLVDRNGGFVSSEEAISYLWEDEPANSVTLARYRKVALRLKNLLEEYGISDIVESVNGKRRLVTEKVSCDLYDYLTGDAAFSQLFKGSYLSNYSWGETTLAELTGEHLY